LVNNICDNALLTGYAINAKTITAEIVAEVAESLDLLRPMIEDDPRQVMAASPAPLPVMNEQVEGDWIEETARQRRRSPSQPRRRSQPRAQRHRDLSLVDQKQNETAQLKLISPVGKKDDEIEDSVKAG
jgi:hypothetical protein